MKNKYILTPLGSYPKNIRRYYNENIAKRTSLLGYTPIGWREENDEIPQF